MAATDFVTETQLDSLTTNIATAVKNNTTALNNKTDDTVVDAHIADTAAAHAASAVSFLDVAGDYTATDVEAALAEVRVVADAAAGGGTAINDSVTNTVDAWSSQKITDYTAAEVNALVAAAPAALDTLNELAAALGDDASFSTTMTTALSLRVRVDAAQAFTAPQQVQGKANLNIVASSVDFASNFNTAIA